MIYLWIKAAHIIAVITWMGGMLVAAVLAAPLQRAPRPLPQQAVQAMAALRAWDRRITTPAMLLTWLLGVTLASLGGWFPSRWLLAKLAVVAALSALHGAQAGALRRAVASDGRPPGPLAGPVIIAAFAVIVVLVVVKPF